MGGPWRDRGSGAKTWRAPAAARTPAPWPDGSPLLPIVIGYIAATLTSIGVLLIILRSGW